MNVRQLLLALSELDGAGEEPVVIRRTDTDEEEPLVAVDLYDTDGRVRFVLQGPKPPWLEEDQDDPLSAAEYRVELGWTALTEALAAFEGSGMPCPSITRRAVGALHALYLAGVAHHATPVLELMCGAVDEVLEAQRPRRRHDDPQ